MAIETRILKRLELAREKSRAAHKEGEVAKLGNLRAGSTGALSPDGEFIGACPRKSLLRSKGVELDPPTTDKLIMFELGYANEDLILKDLELTLSEGETILREEEIPIEWVTKSGSKVTGRPDIVICRRDEAVTVPLLLLELKSVHSLWTSKGVLFERKPKLDNMLQAAHYMWKLGVPGKLIYRSYSQLGQGMAGNEWATKMFPKPGEPGSEWIDYTKQKKDPSKYTIKHIKQFEVVYDLKFDSKGKLYFKLEQEEDFSWTPTIISSKAVENYFEAVGGMEKTDVLSARPLTLEYNGEEASYSNCNYCPLNETCTKLDKAGVKSTAKFLEEVDLFLSTKVSQNNSDV